MGDWIKLWRNQLKRPDLTSGAKMVYSVIRDRMGKSDKSFPSYAFIAQVTGMSRKAVIRAVDELERKAELDVTRRKIRQVNIYRLHVGGVETLLLPGLRGGVETHTSGVETIPDLVSKRHPIKTRLIIQTLARPAPAEKTVPQREMFEAVCETFGLRAQTKSDRKRIGGLARDFVLKGGTPADLPIRKSRLAEKWPNAACTPESLRKHWDSLEGNSTPHERRKRVERDCDAWVSSNPFVFSGADPTVARRICLFVAGKHLVEKWSKSERAAARNLYDALEYHCPLDEGISTEHADLLRRAQEAFDREQHG